MPSLRCLPPYSTGAPEFSPAKGRTYSCASPPTPANPPASSAKPSQTQSRRSNLSSLAAPSHISIRPESVASQRISRHPISYLLGRAPPDSTATLPIAPNPKALRPRQLPPAANNPASLPTSPLPQAPHTQTNTNPPCSAATALLSHSQKISRPSHR